MFATDASSRYLEEVKDVQMNRIGPNAPGVDIYFGDRVDTGTRISGRGFKARDTSIIIFQTAASTSTFRTAGAQTVQDSLRSTFGQVRGERTTLELRTAPLTMAQ